MEKCNVIDSIPSENEIRHLRKDANEAGLAVALMLYAASGCWSPAQAEDKAPQTVAREAAEQVVIFAAGYCKGMEDRHGMDFTTCFKSVTNMAIQKLEDMAVEVKKATPDK